MWTSTDLTCQLVNGRPRHPQSQGAVERANRDVCDMLATWMLAIFFKIKTEFTIC